MTAFEYMEWMGVNLAIPHGAEFVVTRKQAKALGVDPDHLPRGWTLAKPIPTGAIE